MSIVFEDATKMYGAVIGVNRLSFTIGPGLTALLGANGAGKSTVMKLATGQLRPSVGKVTLGGHPAWSSAAREQLGYSPDIDRFYDDWPSRKFVVCMASLHGFPPWEAADRADEALRTVRMSGRSDRRLGACSKGMRQRVKLASALVHDPEHLLLDEPMSGVDPGGRRDLSEVFLELARRGKTVVVSSHLLKEVEPLADAMLMIARGRLVAAGPIAEVRQILADQPLVVEVEVDDLREAAAELVRLESVRGLDVEGGRLRIRTSRLEPFLEALSERVQSLNWNVRRLEVLEGGADAVFQYLDRGAP